jgi:hypothetical protein
MLSRYCGQGIVMTERWLKLWCKDNKNKKIACFYQINSYLCLDLTISVKFPLLFQVNKRCFAGNVRTSGRKAQAFAAKAQAFCANTMPFRRITRLLRIVNLYIDPAYHLAPAVFAVYFVNLTVHLSDSPQSFLPRRASTKNG